jgi:DNA-binding NarL/FixJ family response regulator
MPQLVLVGTAASIEDGLPQLERHLPDVLVLDLDDGYGAEAMAELYDRTRVKILVVTSVGDSALLDRLLAVGVRGVLKKREAPAMLLKAIEKLHDGELWVDQATTERMFMDMARPRAHTVQAEERSRIAALTLRERQTIAAVASDASAPAKVIAGRLCISEHTLRNHLTSIYSKLGLSSRLDLYAYATKHELNKPGGAGH